METFNLLPWTMFPSSGHLIYLQVTTICYCNLKVSVTLWDYAQGQKQNILIKIIYLLNITHYRIN